MQMYESLSPDDFEVVFELVVRDATTGEEIHSHEYPSWEEMDGDYRKISKKIEIYRQELAQEFMERDYEED